MYLNFSDPAAEEKNAMKASFDLQDLLDAARRILLKMEKFISDQITVACLSTVGELFSQWHETQWCLARFCMPVIFRANIACDRMSKNSQTRASYLPVEAEF